MMVSVWVSVSSVTVWSGWSARSRMVSAGRLGSMLCRCTGCGRWGIGGNGPKIYSGCRLEGAMKNAKVTYSHERPPYWEVTDANGRWWSVAYRPDDNNRAIYTITNARGRILDQHGPTGQKILDVVHDHMSGDERLKQ